MSAMSRDSLMAQIKAAAWAPAAAFGVNQAVRMLQEVAGELDASQWSNRNGGDR